MQNFLATTGETCFLHRANDLSFSPWLSRAMYSCSAAEAFLCSAPARGFSNPGASQGSIIWILYNLQSKLASEVSVWGGCKKAKLGMQKRAQTSYLILSNIFVKAVLTAAVFQPKIGAGCGRLKSSAATTVYTGDSGSATLLPFISVCVCVFFLSIKNLFFGLCFQLCLCFLYFLSISERFILHLYFFHCPSFLLLTCVSFTF